ncbi:MAG: STAS domain-containing protein [Magnetococcus sp. YQC-5]
MANKSIVTQREQNRLVIRLRERFDSQDNKNFQSAYQNQKDVESYWIDFQDVDFMDSSALGMLLILRSWAGFEKADITLFNIKKPILDLFSVSQFHKLFKIENLTNEDEED